MNNEIQCIISGKSQVRYGANIQATVSYLTSSQKSGSLDKTDKHFKREETKRLRKYIESQNLWIKDIDLLHFVEQFMNSNGFQKIRNNDYFNSNLGIILEDLHDENVLTSNGILYFIDTVFYLK